MAEWQSSSWLLLLWAVFKAYHCALFVVSLFQKQILNSGKPVARIYQTSRQSPVLCISSVFVLLKKFSVSGQGCHATVCLFLSCETLLTSLTLSPGDNDWQRSSRESLQGSQPYNWWQESQCQPGLPGCQTPQHTDRWDILCVVSRLN